MKLKGCSQARYDSLQPRRNIVSWEEYVLWLLWVSFLSLALALSIALILGITDWNVCFSWINSHVEALTPSMTSTRVELGLPRKLLGLNEVIRMGPWTNRTRVLYEKRHETACSLFLRAHARKKCHVGIQEEGGRLQAEKTAAVWDSYYRYAHCPDEGTGSEKEIICSSEHS